MNNKKNNGIGNRILRGVFICIGIVLIVWFILPFIVYGIINIGNVTGFIVGIALILIGVFEQKICIFFILI